MLHTSFIELSQSALAHNIEFIRDMIGEDVAYSSVVKGNAYGHGIEEFVGMALKCGVDHFSTFSADEAYRVKKITGDSCGIMIMGMIDHDELAWAIENKIEFYVFDDQRLEHAIAAARKVGLPARLHIELETGMNRTGFDIGKLPVILDLLKREKEHVEFMGICTHFAGAESIANYHRISQQQKSFKKTIRKLKAGDFQPKSYHAACSAATIRYPNTRFDLVRIGILQYGFFPTRETLVHYLNKKNIYEDPLKRMISWKSRVMDIKHVKSGEFIGYGTAYFTNVETRIAHVPIGYANGFSRSLSNQGRVLVRGNRVPVVGLVNMSMIAIDTNELDNVEIGDEVVIIGWQGELEQGVASFGEYSEQINYELLTRLPQDIPRRIVE